METTLHRQLKTRFGAAQGGSNEVTRGAFRADALGAEGDWIEIQAGALGPLRTKLRCLLPERAVRVVKPIVVERRIIRRARCDGPVLSARRSPKRGDWVDLFDDLVGLVRVFPHPHLRLDLLAVAIDEVRLPNRRRPGYRVVDRQLRDVYESRVLRTAADFWGLLPGHLPAGFTTLDLAELLARDVAFAQRVAYCLRLTGAVTVCGKRGNRLVYRRPEKELVASAGRV